MEELICKSCNTPYTGNAHPYFPNKNNENDLCYSCDKNMYYLQQYLLKDKVKFMRKIRCEDCNFRLCEISYKNNDYHVCLWCLDRYACKYVVSYGKYKGRSHAFVLQNDFNYCANLAYYRTIQNYKDSLLTTLTKNIYSKYSDKDPFWIDID